MGRKFCSLQKPALINLSLIKNNRYQNIKNTINSGFEDEIFIFKSPAEMIKTRNMNCLSKYKPENDCGIFPADAE